MTNRPQRIGGALSGLSLWLFGLSLVLNVVLGAWLISGSVTPVPPQASASFKPPSLTRPPRIAPPRSDSPDKSPPPFQWSQIESSSYPEYIARLRSVGCPEEVIRDLVTADIIQTYKARARAIWTPSPRPYWKKAREGDRPDPKQLSQLMELDKERQQVQKTLLGVAVRQQDLVDLAFVQLHGAERTLAWLPDGKRVAALAALEQSGYLAEEEKQMMTSAQEGFSRDRAKDLQRQQLEALQGVLSADELKELQMRSSQEAGTLRSELRFFDATQQEFDAILSLRDKMAQDRSVPRDFYARKAAECAALQETLSPQRAREYERNTDLFYVWARQAGERYGLDPDTASQAWEVKRSTLAQADEVRRNAALAEEDKKRRLTELKASAERRIDETLGADAARFARKGDGAWLQILPTRTQP